MDCTKLIERLEVFEDRVGIRLEALFANWDDSFAPPLSYLTVTGEVHPKEGATIHNDSSLVADIYDTAGRLVAHNKKYLYAEKFFGFEPFSIIVRIECPNLQIFKIRLYPK